METIGTASREKKEEIALPRKNKNKIKNANKLKYCEATTRPKKEEKKSYTENR